MTFLAETWYLFAVALVSGFLLLWPTLRRGAPAGGIDVNEAVRLINRERAVVIDVREPDEFATGHANNAKNIPLGSLEESKALPKNKSLPVVVMCNRGAHSSRAVFMLRKLGYENARTLTGGLVAWREANMPIAKSV